jgi:hypothetical protein
MEEATVTISIAVKVKPEPNVTVQDKVNYLRNEMTNQAATYSNAWDYGVHAEGSISDDIPESEPIVIDAGQPDYEE